MTVDTLSPLEIIHRLETRPRQTLADSHRGTRGAIERVVEKHGQGAASVIRPSNIPAQNGRPGIGRAKEPNFFKIPTVLSLGMLENERGHYVNLASRVGYLGRPTTPRSDFGEPPSEDNEKYRALRVELCGEGVGQTALYGLLPEGGQWIEITDLYRTEMSEFAPDREIFMNSCLIPTTSARHAGKIKPFAIPVYSIADLRAITAVR